MWNHSRSAKRSGSVAVLLLLVAAQCRGRWLAADEFESRLRCGVRLSDVKESARSLGADEMGVPTAKSEARPDLPDYYIAAGVTVFSLWTRDDVVIAYVRTDDIGDSELPPAPRVNTCSATPKPPHSVKTSKERH
jgi:hypothetical protein